MQPDSVPASAPTFPPATRSATARWRDPRLAGGVLIIACSVLLGVWSLGDSEDEVAVWALRDAHPAGSRIEPGDLVPRRVRFPEGGGPDRYLPVGSSLTGQTLTRPVGAGELLPRAAVVDGQGPGLVQVPIPVDAVVFPPSLRPGDVVDLWAVPEKSTGVSRARRLLHDASVVAVPGARDPLAPAGPAAVLIAVAAEQADQSVLADVIAATSRGPVVLTLRGGR